MSYTSRRVLTPRASLKRKEMDAIDFSTSGKSLVPLTTVSPAVCRPYQAATASKGPDQQPLPSNRLLAGYMAFEFISNGTLLGQKFEPAGAEALQVHTAESKRNKPSQPDAADGEPSGKLKPQCYADVASLLRKSEGGAHIPGVVNPTQLARWIQM